jgi:hypothetical protein
MTLFKGMYLNIKDNKLFCYGIGVINYMDKMKPVFLYSTIDTCVKSIEKPNCYDIGIIDSRDLEKSFRVVASTYFSIFMIMSISLMGIVATKKMLRK